MDYLKEWGTGVWMCCIVLLTMGCGGMRQPATHSQTLPAIFPDYTDVTIPPNMAPLNFMMEGAEHIQARFLVDGREMLAVSGDETIDIPAEGWQTLLHKAAGGKMQVEVAAWDAKHPDGIAYRPFTVEVARDSIDPWIAYRLIEPGYEAWRFMGIYQREISSFTEREIVSNKTTKSACVNCHHFDRRSAQRMMFHARGENGGTIFLDHGQLKKIDPKATGPHKGAVYPAWHPEGRYLAFSSNTTNQTFFGQGRQPIEVYDRASDLILYDTQEDRMTADPRFTDERTMETFPAWSPDGRWLYFCSAPAKQLPDERHEMHYSILRVAFDSHTGLFGAVDTVYNARTEGGSASFPRISPDGRWLLFTLADYGTFPIWHDEADLKMTDLTTGKAADVEAWNAKNQTDSYHAWSANGRWVMFASRRLDGRYTRVYFGYLDGNGKAHKPFLLPQKDPRSNTLRLKSYNIPDFVDGPVEMPQSVVELFRCPDKLIQ